MRPIPTKERLPEDTNNIWWFNSEEDFWELSTKMSVVFDEDNKYDYDKYTYWLPMNEIPLPRILNHYEIN